MRAIQISSFGKPTDILKLLDIPEPSALLVRPSAGLGGYS